MLLFPILSESGKAGRLEVFCLELRPPLVAIHSVRTMAHSFPGYGSPLLHRRVDADLLMRDLTLPRSKIEGALEWRPDSLHRISPGECRGGRHGIPAAVFD